MNNTCEKKPLVFGVFSVSKRILFLDFLVLGVSAFDTRFGNQPGSPTKKVSFIRPSQVPNFYLLTFWLPERQVHLLDGKYANNFLLLIKN